jgi:hypothetical protein
MGIYTLYAGLDSFVLVGNCDKCGADIHYISNYTSLMMSIYEMHREALNDSARGRKILKEEDEKEKKGSH